MRDEHDPTAPRGVPRRGQALFGMLFLAFGAVLLSQFRGQTTRAEDTLLVAQPGFWPAVGVGGMVLFGALHLARMPRRRPGRADWQEGRVWLSALEFCGWFLAYVFLVPVIGYLFASVAFLPALIWRLGYRGRPMLWASVAVAVAVVVLFKAFLDVKIPGGAIYDYLPGVFRSFFILNL